MATNATFLSTLQGLSVTGVSTHLDEPPLAVATADLPLAFPATFSGNMPIPVVGCRATNKTRVGQFVIVVQAVAQDTLPENYGKLAALMDNLETALDAQAGSLANFVEYEISWSADYPIAGTAYWAIVADITARDVP